MVIKQPIGKMSVFKIKSMEVDNEMKVVAVSAVTSHVQNMSAYSRAQVASLFQQGLQFVTALFE